MKKPRPRTIKERAVKTAMVTAPASALASEAPAPAEKKRRTGPIQFLREVRAEIRKITWTSRKETIITSIMVFIMVVVAGIFFFVDDFLLNGGISYILKFANSGQS